MEGKGPTEQGDPRNTWLTRKNLWTGGPGVCAWRETLKLLGMVKGHLLLEAPRRGAKTPSYLLSPRSRVLSFMRAVSA